MNNTSTLFITFIVRVAIISRLTIQVQMRLNVFPNFFLSKQNIFMESNSQVLKFNYDELTRLIRNLKKYPASLCCYTGCEELGKNESEKSECWDSIIWKIA
jgi:hypothetical protein